MINIETAKARLMTGLSRHIGKEKAIGASELFAVVYGETPETKINHTRQLRKLVTEMRHDGVPIASTSSNEGGGYYLPRTDSELKDYLDRHMSRGLKSLAICARVKNLSLSEYLGQIRLNLMGDANEGSSN